MPTRPMQPDDVRRQVVLEEHDLARDARFAIVIRRTVAGNDYRSHLWRVRLDGPARQEQLTDGRVRDTRPRISPDGRRLLFIRRELDGRERPGRLVVLDLARPTARPRSVVPPDLAASAAEWSPDGQRIAFVAEVDPPRFIVGPGPARGTQPLARVIRRIDWRYDEVGHVDRWSHLHVVDVRRGARPVRLTEGDWGVDGIAWRPDGSEIAFAANRAPDPDLYPRSAIWAVAAEASEPAEPRPVLELRGWADRPAWSPDGREVVAVGVDEPGAPDEVSPGLWVGSAGGASAGAPRPLAPALDRPIGQWADADLTGWTASARGGPFWVVPDRVIATVTDRGRSVPFVFPVAPGAGPEPATDAGLVTQSLAVAAPGGEPRISVLATQDGRAPELLTLDGPRPQSRTTNGSAWQRRVALPVMRRVQAPGPAGSIDTWIASPPGAGDGPLPTILDVHGGPLGAWTATPPFEAHLLAGRGYRVVMPNIRGSTSYGRDWIDQQLGDWGGADAADAHAALDHVIELGLADPGRLGVLGLSYGGFMVHWLIGTSDRFRAAVSENGVVNQVSAWANSDTGVAYDRTARLGDVFSSEGIDRLWRQSPLAHVAAIRTPLLMFQAEADRRCPPADNEQLFVALRALGREVEYVLYPDEFHTYAISGRPDRRIDRHTRMLAWFDHYIGGGD